MPHETPTGRSRFQGEGSVAFGWNAKVPNTQPVSERESTAETSICSSRTVLGPDAVRMLNSGAPAIGSGPEKSLALPSLNRILNVIVPLGNCAFVRSG